MTEFKAGDRVEVIAAEDASGYKNGDIVTIKRPFTGGEGAYIFTVGGGSSSVYNREIRHYTPAPDVIMIDRNDLPEVVDNGLGWLLIGDLKYDIDRTIEWRRNAALTQLAVAEFLEARERQAAEDAEAAKLGEQVMQERRDVLAREIAQRACYVNFDNFTYEDHVAATQSAINMLIESQDAAKC